VSPDWPIETDRLLLRPFGPDDLGDLYAMHSDAEVSRYLYNPPRTLDETHDLLSRKIAGAAIEAEGDWLSAAVVVSGTGECVGDLALHYVSEPHRTAEIGFVFQPRHQRKGFATEAAAAFVGWAFASGFHRVIGRTEARNTVSARVLEKLGMRLEAHFVENEWVKGEWQSGLVYAILEHEWH